MQEQLCITLIQSILHWENPQANLEMFSSKIASITDPTDLILLPETFSTAFSMDSRQYAEELNGTAMQWMQKEAKKHSCVIAGSLMFKEKDEYFNRLIWMRPDGTFETYDKRHLFAMGGEDEPYAKGEKVLIVELNGWKICPMICYDLRFPVWSRNKLIGKIPAYDVLLYVANWPEKRIHHWKTLLAARAIENQCYSIGLNRFGKDGNDFNYTGDSMVVDAGGEILYHKSGAEDIYTTTLSIDKLKLIRRQFPFLKDADGFVIS